MLSSKESNKYADEVCYMPAGSGATGLEMWRFMALELWLSRELTWRFFLRDFSARYRQSLLGYIWALLPTIVTVATFTWLSRAHVLAIKGTTLPYPLFVLIGLTVWQLFANGLTGATQSLVNAGSLISKINFPRETLVLAAFGQSVFEFCLRALLILLAFAVYRVAPAWPVILVPLMLLPLCLLTLGVGFLCALSNSILRDIGQVIAFALPLAMFLTPVVYPAVTTGPRAWLNVLNPVSPFVIAAQDLTCRGVLSQPRNYLAGCIVSLVVFLAGWRLFHATEPRIAERV